MAKYIQVSTTTRTREDAERIARLLVEARLAACVQVLGPVTSVYRWQGQTETASEWLCLVKTEARLFPQVEAAIREVHPYEVPEIIAVPITAGSDPYVSWLGGALTDDVR